MFYITDIFEIIMLCYIIKILIRLKQRRNDLYEIFNILLSKFIYNLVEDALKLSLRIRKKQDTAYSTLNVRLIFSLHSISFEWEIEGPRVRFERSKKGNRRNKPVKSILAKSG